MRLCALSPYLYDANTIAFHLVLRTTCTYCRREVFLTQKRIPSTKLKHSTQDYMYIYLTMQYLLQIMFASPKHKAYTHKTQTHHTEMINQTKVYNLKRKTSKQRHCTGTYYYTFWNWFSTHTIYFSSAVIRSLSG